MIEAIFDKKNNKRIKYFMEQKLLHFFNVKQ